MRKWAGIVRVSHMGERKAGAANVHTDRDQVEAIRGAAPDGETLEILPPELDVSGGLPLDKRPSLRVAVEGVERGEYAGIIVAYQSRLFRNVEEEEAVWRRVEAAGGEVLLALDGLDTTTVGGRMTRRIKAAINAAEREEHTERFERLRRYSTAAGIWQRRQTPTGYRRDPQTRRLVPDERAPDVVAAFTAAAAGESRVQISRDLGMTTSGVRALLRNRVYLGELRVGQHINPGAHPAIVDADLFDAVQAVLEAAARPARSDLPPALLRGLVRCAACGHVMTRRKNRDEVNYACPVHHSGERCPAPSQIATHRLDAYVEAIALVELERVRVSAKANGRVGELRATIADAERRRAGLLNAFDPAEAGADALAQAVRRHTATIEKAEAELRAELAREAAIPATMAAVEVWGDLDAHERNTVLRGLVAAVVVRRASRGGRPLPVSERAVVIRAGTPLEVADRRSEVGAGIVPIPFDPYGPGVLRVPVGEDAT